MKNKEFVIGDTHGDWGKLNAFLTKKKPALVLQVGDFGFWPKQSGTTLFNPSKFDPHTMSWKPAGPPWRLDGIKNKDTKIHWCDGNHEDHWELAKIKSNEILPNVFYQKRGSVLTLPDGRNVLFMGGADSIDKDQRTLGVDWFPEETITQKDLHVLPNIDIDIVVSHTCPVEFLYGLDPSFKAKDPSCEALSAILKLYKPKRWYFGHWHQPRKGSMKGCFWTALGCMGNSGGWVKLT